MAFEFAYALDGAAISTIKDFPLETLANYKSGAGTNDWKKGDLVSLNASGKIIRTKAADAKAIGVIEGFEFTGLVAQGQPYAASRASFLDSAQDTTRYPNGVVKVRIESDSVYRVPVTGSAPTLGTAYAIVLDAAGDQKVNQASVTNPLVKVVDYDATKNVAFCILASNSTF